MLSSNEILSTTISPLETFSEYFWWDPNFLIWSIYYKLVKIYKTNNIETVLKNFTFWAQPWVLPKIV